MPSVAELIRDHVTLTVDCVDRLYLNAYVPRLQAAGGVAGFLHRRGPVVSPALFGPITDSFRERLRTWCDERGIPVVQFQRRQRKDDLVEPYRKTFTGEEGVVLVGVAQERAQAWRGVKRQQGTYVSFDFVRSSVFVNHYYVYFIDRDWGPGFLKICSYAPYTMKLCLNGHEWAKRQASRQGISFTPLDNGFLACDDPAALQAICDRLGAHDVQDCFTRWLGQVPVPLGPADTEAGYAYRLSMLQMEVSRTQVFDRPLRGREFFEEVLRDHLDLGRPSRIQLLFERRVTRQTPGRFLTRVITAGVTPSLQVAYKRCLVNQYFKEGRALRTETIVNDSNDLGVRRGLQNFATLRAIGQQLNRNLLQLERTAHDCGLADAELAALVLPSVTTGGQPAPALRFGQPRVTALLQALSLFALLPSGITNARLRPLVAELLCLPADRYTARQMGYDLRRLARKGLIQRPGRQLRYVLTPYGRRVAVFLTKLYGRVLRPALRAVDTSILSTAPPPLRTLFARLDTATDQLLQDAHLIP